MLNAVMPSVIAAKCRGAVLLKHAAMFKIKLNVRVSLFLVAFFNLLQLELKGISTNDI
jgi:hypothetical protein